MKKMLYYQNIEKLKVTSIYRLAEIQTPKIRDQTFLCDQHSIVDKNH